jgi:hypothetical protein
MEDVARAFEHDIDEPDWRRREDPWRFYSPQAIVRRQQRWAKEFLEGADDDDSDATLEAAFDDAPDDAFDDELDDPAEPYKRTLPKIGRSDQVVRLRRVAESAWPFDTRRRARNNVVEIFNNSTRGTP